MLKHLLNETAVLKAVENVDEYDIPVISDIKTLKCRIEFAVKSEENSGSSKKTYPARMFCVDEVNTGDIISYNSVNYKVIQVNAYEDLDGQIMLREVYLL
ncbi:MAG: hypothetical protein ACI37T_02325 [Candidatus Gastranaerophilaceae bacterium]